MRTVRLAALVATLAVAVPVGAVNVKSYPLPAPTAWTSAGCRGVHYADAVVPPRRWTNLHGDLGNSDEVSRAHAPVFAADWTVEQGLYSATGPVFDAAGNLYVSPVSPYENVVLVSLDPGSGARRWAVAGTGAPPGGSAPMVLRDPDAAGAEIVYLALYDRVLAVRTDGSTVWDVPSGLTFNPAGDPLAQVVLGTNYVPGVDAVVGVTTDGWIFAVDRRTGAPRLNAPFQLPGVATPSAPPIALPPAALAAADGLFRSVVNTPPGSLQRFIDLLLGNAVELANMFGVDPRTGRLWVAATAPDGEDGRVDGVSALGALYRLELVPSGGGLDVVETCHRSFAGGSASTPTLSPDGARVYLGDNFGKLLAVADDCSLAWELDLGAQILGSVVVSADNREIYASSRLAITKVIEQGAAGQLVWNATIDPFENLAPGQTQFNLLLATAVSNGLLFQAGAGVLTATGTPLPVIQGIGLLDRDTGTIRWFAEGGDESIAVLSVGPDGVMYLANSPVRRLFAQALGLSPAPLRFGVTKFAAQRLDLLARDAACAGADRALNAHAQRRVCPDAAGADAVQVRELIAQGRDATNLAVAEGDLDQRRAKRVMKSFTRADTRLVKDVVPGRTPRNLRRAGRALEKACRRLTGV